MPLIDTTTGILYRDFTNDQLVERANYMRGLNLISLHSAGSGHSGGTLSMMDICAVLYLKIAKHDPHNPFWAERDRIVWSAGHKAPALYTSLAVSGYFSELELAKLRMLGSPLQGHPHWRGLPGVEISSGSLGQGCSVAVGMALSARLDHKDFRVFAICSDGEHQEGSLWETVMSASHNKLDNLTFVIDKNGLQIDGPVSEVMNIEPLADKYRAFGWNVLEVDGHHIDELVKGFESAYRNANHKPTALICRTVKGKGVSFMENVVAWHGKPPNREQLDSALTELGIHEKFEIDRMLDYGKEYQTRVETTLQSTEPSFSRSYWWNSTENMQTTLTPTRVGFGRALKQCGDDERIVCLGADISDSICISDFCKNHPKRINRFISVGIAEQNATTIAAGLAKEGKIPVFGTYGVFASARNLDQIRVSICYAGMNVLIVGAHGGVSVGPDGATHQELEALFQMCGLPNMHVGVPCDSIEAEKMTQAMLFDIVGPKYLRLAREATPNITHVQSPFHFGKANIFRLRREAAVFADAFEITLSDQYRNEQEDLTIISCGPELAEALRAAYILKAERGIETRVINMHTVKPLDRLAIHNAYRETKALMTAEEHQVGGLGNLVAGVILQSGICRAMPIKFAMVGVLDRFGESGQPWQLIRKYGLSAEWLADKAMKLLV